MTLSEWLEVVAVMRAFWPHAPISPEAATVQHQLVCGTDRHAAEQAIKLVALEGRQHPPNSGEIAARAAELGADAIPSWSQALGAIRDTARRHASSQPRAAAIDLDKHGQTLVAAFVRERGWASLVLAPLYDPDRGSYARHELERAWGRFVERAAERQRLGLAVGTPRREIEGPRPIGDAVGEIIGGAR
jgi:hypothetical protein